MRLKSETLTVDLGKAEVCWDRVPCQQDGACSEITDVLLDKIEEGLVSQAPAIDLVSNVGEWGPCYAEVSAFINRKVDCWWFRRVVLPDKCQIKFGQLLSSVRLTMLRGVCHQPAGLCGRKESLGC